MRQFVTINKSYEISYAGTLAVELAIKRSESAMGCQDYFAAIYLVNREILLPYWTAPRLLDEFIRNVCGLHEPIWFHWVELSQALKTRGDTGIMAPCSQDLAIILDHAGKIAGRRRSEEKSTEIAQITVDDLMLAFASHPDFQFVREMFAFGFRGAL